MTWWGRLWRSIVSLAAADFVFSFFVTLLTSKQEHWWSGFAAWLFATGLFGLAGWILSLPFVLAIRDVRESQYLILGTFGTLIGPLTIVIIDIIGRAAEPNAGWSFGLSFMALTLPVSALTTGLYLYLLHVGEAQPSL